MALSSDYVITALTGKQGIQGDKGATGATGASGKSVIAQYSVDGSSSWHSTYTSGDIYMRTSTDSGSTWSSAMRIVGEKGATGAKGDKGDKGATGATGASGITLKCNVGSLNYTLQRNKKANYETQSFTLALYQGSTLLTPSSSSITTSNVKNLTVSKSGTTTITITATATYNGAIPSGYIIATLVYNNVSYTMNIPITTNYNGKYLGLLSALPSSANLGDYFVASKTFSASNTTYTQSFVYERVCSASNTYAWIVSTEINSVEVFSDILSLANASSNTQAVAIVQRLVASDIFVNNLSAQKILFQHFVASSSVNEKAKVGDQIISMGYNPKDSSDTDFSFMIQKCIQAADESTGQEEIWMKHFWTKFLASGLLTLNLSGCLQTTGDVKTNPASVWKENKSFSAGVYRLWAGTLEDTQFIVAGLYNGDIYVTTDNSTWTLTYDSGNSKNNNYSPVWCFGKYNGSLYAAVGKTSDTTHHLLKYDTATSTWTDVATVATQVRSLLEYNNKLFIGYFLSARYSTYTDDDGLTTIKNSSNLGQEFIFKNELYCISYLKNVFKFSTDSNNFEQIGTTPIQLNTITVSDKYIVITFGQQIAISQDGINWTTLIPTVNGKGISGSISCCFNDNDFAYGLFLFGLETSDSTTGNFLYTTDFENFYEFTPNTTYSGWTCGCYSPLTESFLIGGADSYTSGYIYRADYTSLSSLGAISQAPYITASKLASTGYVKWSNGLLIQWGQSSASNNTSNYYQENVTMPLAYKSASSYQVALNGIPSGSVPGFVCALDSSAANNTTWTAQRFGMQLMYCENPHWIAIGYV